MFIQVFSGINIYFLVASELFYVIVVLAILSASLATKRIIRNIVHTVVCGGEGVEGGKPAMIPDTLPNNFTMWRAKCFFNIVSKRLTTFTADKTKALKFQVPSVGSKKYQIQDFMFFEGTSDNIIQPT